MRKLSLLALLTCFFALHAASPVLAETKFKIGVEMVPYEPYFSIKDGQYVGYSRELLDRFAASKGYTFVYVPLPINRLWRDFFDGSLDFKYPDNPIWRGDQKTGKDIAYSNGLVGYIDGIMVKPANRKKGKDSLKVLGTTLGFTPFDFLDAVKSGKVKLNENPSMDHLLDQAIIGRVDGAYISIAGGEKILQKKGKSGELVFDDSLPFTKSEYRLSSMKNRKVIEEFNTFLQENKDFVNQLKTKYGLQKY